MIKDFGKFKITYRRQTADEKVIKHSFGNDIYLSNVYCKFLFFPQKHHVAIEIGAHIGTFSILLASKITRGKIYAIEASYESYQFLKRNVELNSLTNVNVFHLAVSDRQGTAKLYWSNDGNWGHSIVKPFSATREIVPTDTLENFMSNNHIKICHFLKLNCEGAEFQIILRTPFEVLRRIKFMMILYHADLEKGYDVASLPEYLHRAGFLTLITNKSKDRGWIFAVRKNIINHIRIKILEVCQICGRFYINKIKAQFFSELTR